MARVFEKMNSPILVQFAEFDHIKNGSLKNFFMYYYTACLSFLCYGLKSVLIDGID